MSDRPHKTRKQKQKSQKQPKSKPSRVVEQATPQPENELPLRDTASVSSSDPISAGADLLADRRYPVVQRQNMAAQLGQQMGNRYMQAVVSRVDQKIPQSLQRENGKAKTEEGAKEEPKDKITQLREALKKPAGAGEILALLGSATKKERRKIVKDKALVSKLAANLGRGDLLKAMDLLKMPLKDKLEVAMSGWAADVEVIKRLTSEASKKDKRKILKDKALVSRLSTAVSPAEMVTILGNLNAPLKERLSAALGGWGVDEVIIRKLLVEAKNRERKKVLADKTLMATMASAVSVDGMMSILKDCGVKFNQRFKMSLTYWKPTLDELGLVVNGGAEKERQSLAKSKKLMAMAEAHLGNLPYLKFLTILQPAKYVAIGTEVVEVSSEDEAKEAKRIFKDIKDNYGIEIDSPAGIEAIKKNYPKAPAAVKAKLKVAVWKYRELVAIEKALAAYAPILGSDRADSSRKGIAQEVTSISKIANAIDTNDPSGKLDTTTLGEYFGDSKNFSMFISGEKSKIDFKDNKVQLQATAIHEIAHGLLKHEVGGYASALEYWKDVSTKSGKKGAEKPITKYGRTNASEDLSEAMMFYFVKTARLKKKCPKRFALIKTMVESWKPKVAAAAP